MLPSFGPRNFFFWFWYCFTSLLTARVISGRELHVFTLASSRNSQLHTTRGTTVQSPIRYRSTLTDCTSVLYQQGIHWFYVPNLYSIKLLRHWDINYSLPGVDTGHVRIHVTHHGVSNDNQSWRTIESWEHTMGTPIDSRQLILGSTLHNCSIRTD